MWIRYSVVSIMTRLRAEGQGNRHSTPGRGKEIDFLCTLHDFAGHTQAPIQWISDDYFPGGKATGA
jgi:hypothetical protein